MNVHDRSVPVDAEFHLGEFLAFLRSVKWRIISFVGLCTLAAAAAGLFLPKSYRVSVLLAPVTTTIGSARAGALSSLVSEFGGGLASLAGSLGNSDSKRFESVAVLESEALTERYIAENHLLPVLYAKRWDAVHGRWKETDPERSPTLWKASQFFKKDVRDVTTDHRTGLVTLRVVWKDPRVAARWANGLVKLTNDYLRKKALDESQRNIAYLTEQAAKTDMVGAKEAIFANLQNEINKEMLARGTEEYAFKVLDPAVPPERPSFPRPKLFTALGFVGSLAISLMYALAWMSWAAKERAGTQAARHNLRRAKFRSVPAAATNTAPEDRWR